MNHRKWIYPIVIAVLMISGATTDTHWYSMLQFFLAGVLTVMWFDLD